MVKNARKAAARKAKGRKTATRSTGLFELRPLRASRPVSPFMCFRTPDRNVFIKCDWNPAERRFNLNCRQVGPDECIGGE